MITEEKIPTLEGTDVLSAKKWFAELFAAGFGGFHADDPLVGEHPDVLDNAAARKAQAIIDRIRSATKGWPDPEFIYSLAAEGGFKIEADYPGFVVDRSIPAADRTGYVSVAGQKLPTLIVEENGTFALLRFSPGRGRLSECAVIEVVPVLGASFRADNPDQPYIDPSAMAVLEDEAVRVASFEQLDDAITEVTSGKNPLLRGYSSARP